MNISYSKPTIGIEEDEAALRVLHSGWLACGPETEAFEQEFAEYVGVKYAIFTNSCTSALKIAYKWANKQCYHAAIYEPNTFCATYSAAIESGIDAYSTENLDKAHRAYGPLVTDLTHLWEKDVFFRVNMAYGGIKDETPCLIEDSAHRIEPNDPLVGKIRCYSFYVTKNMTTAQGGMFTTNDKEIYDYARLQWRDGLTTSTADRLSGFTGYRVEAMAGGYDGNDITAAIGRVQLRKLPEFTARRNAIRDLYNTHFEQDWQGNHLYPYFVEDEPAVYRLIAKLKEKGIACSHNYPNTGWNGISLPIYPLLTEEEAEYIIKHVKHEAATL